MEEVQCSCGHNLYKMSGIKTLLRFIRTNTISVIMVLLLCVVHTDSVKDPTPFEPDWTGSSRIFYNASKNDKQYYRKFVLHQDRLYVGAKNHLYRFDTRPDKEFENPEVSDDLSKGLDASVVKDCERNHNKNSNCANHIRTILFHGDEIVVCGTGAFKPITSNLTAKLKFNGRHNPEDSGLALCPYDPQDNATWVWVGPSDNTDEGNPFNQGQIYSATVADAAKSDPLIYRPEIQAENQKSAPLVRTMPQDHYWLNDAQFVGSFSVEKYVYFFFRETALESGKTTFARVARICKKDLGGRGILENVWTTFFKARLVCSVDDVTPYYFNEIYDVVKLDAETFVGTFTTNFKKGFYGSAVCAFKLEVINNAFNEGSFKDPLDDWKSISNGRIPDPRPGMCNDDSTKLSSEVLPFIKTFPLMDRAVLHHLNMPIYSKMDILFYRMAVHETSGKDNHIYKVLFLAAGNGEIHKVLYGIKDGKYQSKLLGILHFQRANNLKKLLSDSVWAMTIHMDHLFVGTDQLVAKLDVRQCQVYSVCTSCAADPYCGWDTRTNECRPYTSNTNSLIQDVFGKTLKSCSKSCLKSTTPRPVRMKGDPIYLHCDSFCESSEVKWYSGSDEINVDQIPPKYFLTKNNTLVILNNTDNATYTCKSDGVQLAQYTVRVPICSDPSCIWRDEFNTWCTEFDKYREAFKKWQCQRKEGGICS